MIIGDLRTRTKFATATTSVDWEKTKNENVSFCGKKET